MTRREDLVIDLLLGRADGLSAIEIGKVLKLTPDQVRLTLSTARLAGRLDLVFLAGGKAVWLQPGPARALRERLREESRVRRHLAQQAQRAAAKAAGKKRLRDIDLDAVPDLPVRRMVTSTWAPVRVPPGPVSVFNLGASHA